MSRRIPLTVACALVLLHGLAHAQPGDDFDQIPGDDPAPTASTTTAPATTAAAATGCPLKTRIDVATDACVPATPSIAAWKACVAHHETAIKALVAAEAGNGDTDQARKALDERFATASRDFDTAAAGDKEACDDLDKKTKAAANDPTVAEAEAGKKKAADALTTADAATPKPSDEARTKLVAAVKAAAEALDRVKARSDAEKKRADTAGKLAAAEAAYDKASPLGKHAKALETRQRDLKALEEAADPAVQFGKHACSRDDIVCVDHDGLPLLKEIVPAETTGGEVFTVKTFVTTAQQDAGETMTVVFFQQRSLDVAFEARKTDKKDPNRAATVAVDKAPDTLHVKEYVADPIDGEAETFVITITTRKGDTRLAPRTYELRVRRGFSFYSVAILIAVTLDGDRTVRPDLSVLENTAVEAAFALNVFPLGRPRGTIGYLRQCPRWEGKKTALCLARLFGFTVATDIDLSKPFDRLYFGAILEPVAGLSLTAGLSLREVDLVPPGAGLPPLIEGDEQITPERGRVLRPYVGITLTLDLLETLAELKRAAGAISF